MAKTATVEMSDNERRARDRCAATMTAKKAIREQIIFVLDDDNELMRAALDSNLDPENKRMNRELIKKHEELLSKLDRGELLSQKDLRLIRDANEIHVNDADNLNGHHKEAIALEDWLDKMIELSKEEATKILEEYLDRDPKTPTRAYRALHALWEEATPNGVAKKAAFDDEGKCLKCGSRVSFADVTDTVVFVGEEIVKRYDGDISNRNCVRCTYPEQYPDFEDYDEGDEE
jgi:hypothetical protein